MSSTQIPDGTPARTPSNYPPPPAPYAQQPSPERQPGGFRKGFGTGIGLGLGLAATVAVFSVLAGIFSVISLGVLVSSAGPGVSATPEVIWGTPGATSKLRAIDVSGAIMTSASEGALLSAGTYGYEIADMIDALETEDAAGLVLLVNTPGGTITGSKAISDAIERYQERTGQKVMVHVQGMSASGGVYSTAPADLIYADHGSIVGSVGVIYGPFTQYDGVVATSGSILESGVTTTGGITQEYFTKGTGKDWGNPFRPLTEEERAMLDDLLQPEYDRFVAHVSTHRDVTADELVNELGAGVFENARAEEVGFIDGTLGREEFFREAATQAGLDPDDTVVEALAEPGPLDSLLGVERKWGSAPALAPAAGEVPFLNSSICGASTPLVIAGDVAAVCG